MNEHVCPPKKINTFMALVETLIDHNDCHNVQFSNEKLQQAVSTAMEKTEEEERDAKRNSNNVAMDTFIQYPVMTNTQRNIANVPNERRISSDILTETIKLFKGLTLQSKINNSAYYNSEEDDTESDPNSDPKVDTHTSDGNKRKVTDTDTTNGNYPHKLLINRLTPEIIPVVIPPIDRQVEGICMRVVRFS